MYTKDVHFGIQPMKGRSVKMMIMQNISLVYEEFICAFKFQEYDYKDVLLL